MVQITRDEVIRLAVLSQLQLKDDEIEDLQGDLARILEYVKQLDDLDTSDVEPTYQVTDLENVSREDVVAESGVNREQLLALAPESEDNQVKVPQVL